MYTLASETVHIGDKIHGLLLRPPGHRRVSLGQVTKHRGLGLTNIVQLKEKVEKTLGWQCTQVYNYVSSAVLIQSTELNSDTTDN